MNPKTPGRADGLWTSELIVTCEHGGRQVPSRWRSLFAGYGALLASHRGYDPGALHLARHLAGHFEAALFYSVTTRLLVELNRSLHHPRLFSEVTRHCSPAERQQLVRDHYQPYRTTVEQRIASHIAAGRSVTHLSMHSFTPVLDGHVRTADVGLLYDPGREAERALCGRWQRELLRLRPDLRVRRNYPYLGTADGFTTYLRRRFLPSAYCGIEVEVNQRWVKNRPGWQRLRAGIIAAFATARR